MGLSLLFEGLANFWLCESLDKKSLLPISRWITVMIIIIIIILVILIMINNLKIFIALPQWHFTRMILGFMKGGYKLYNCNFDFDFAGII